MKYAITYEGQYELVWIRVLSAHLRNAGEGFDLQLIHREAPIDHHHQTLLIQLLVMGENLNNMAQSTL